MDLKQLEDEQKENRILKVLENMWKHKNKKVKIFINGKGV